MVEQRSSSVGGQDKKKETGSKLTGQTGSLSGLTGPQGGLTGSQAGLTGASNRSEGSYTAEIRTKPSFKELLAKYEKEEAAQKQKGRPNEIKDAKSTSTFGEQLDFCPCQGNCVTMPYSGLIAPLFWPLSSYYTPLDYNRTHIQSYYIQYPSMYPSCVSPRRIVTSINLVKIDLYCSKEGEKSTKPD